MTQFWFVLLFILFVDSQWISEKLSISRSLLASASVDTIVLFAGGTADDGVTPSNVVDIYDSQLNNWTKSSLSTPRYSLTASTVVGTLGKSAMFAGGFDDEGKASHVVDIFNSWTMSWEIMNLSLGRGNLASTSIGPQIFFAGGDVDKKLTVTDVVDIYHAHDNAWKATTLSVARSNLAATTVESFSLVYFAGGYELTGAVSNVIDIYNVKSDIWTTATLSVGRANLAAVSIEEEVLFGGGMTASSGGFSAVVDIYHFGSDVWSTSGLTVPRAYLSAGSTRGKALFAGGEYETILFEYASSSAVDVYHKNNTWSEVYLSVARYNMGFASDKFSNLYFAGGTFSGTLEKYSVDTVDIYSDDFPFNPTSSPSSAPTLPTSSPSTVPTPPTLPPPPTPPTDAPTVAPTVAPTKEEIPTIAPTDHSESPTHIEEPTETPTDSPTDEPTEAPSEPPTDAPTLPTDRPTRPPTDSPTSSPTRAPTNAPTYDPNLSAGEIAGMTVAGAIFIIGLIVLAMWFFNCFCWKRSTYNYIQ